MNFVPDLTCKGRLVGYARVSTPEQRLDLQIDCLKSAGCVRIFKDHGISGAKAKRPGLDAMLADLQRDDMVVVYKLDRLGRSVLHLSDLLVRFQHEGIHFCSLSEGINTATPAGKLTFHLFSAVARIPTPDHRRKHRRRPSCSPQSRHPLGPSPPPVRQTSP